MKSFTIDKLKVAVYKEKKALGEAAAEFVAQKLKAAILEKNSANMILATGASQFSFLKALQKKEIEWHKITVFHLDEYKGISERHPASFRRYLKERILNAVAPKKIFFLTGDSDALEKVMEDYAAALQRHPIDIACIGIGENGHIAFNDPPIADFKDPKLVKLAVLDKACRRQQLGEGWFPTLEDVPKEALTLTIPAIMNSQTISCVVPDARKAQAVYDALYKSVDPSCPASILRTHSDTKLFLDTSSASKINL